MLETDALCAACGNIVVEEHYQARAADEAHRTVFTCNKCPLDFSKLCMTPPPSLRDDTFPRMLTRRMPIIPLREQTSYVGKFTMLVVKVPVSLYESIDSDGETQRRAPVSLATSRYGIRAVGMRFYSGVLEGHVSVVSQRRLISPTVEAKMLDLHATSCPPVNEDIESDGEYKRIYLSESTKAVVYMSSKGNRKAASVQCLIKGDSATATKAVLSLCMSLGYSLGHMRDYVTQSQLGSINNLSPRAWDSKPVQNRNYIYSPKIDGERAYVLVYPCIAYMFSKEKGLPLVGWRILEREEGGSKPIVMDVENTSTHGCYLIDMLTDSEGNSSPHSRGYGWVSEQFKLVESSLYPLKVKVRRYYSSLRDAQEESLLMSCPTDGVVASALEDTTARKMKVERSMELLFTEQGSLCTSDGDIVATGYSAPLGVKPGDIVEVRFKLSRDGREIKIVSSFRRHDKTKANDSVAVMSILKSFVGVARDDESRRRMVLAWCNSVRGYIVDRAVSIEDTKRVILDVGTGTGQSLDSLTDDRGVSYVLLEPDPDRCEMIGRRLKIPTIHREPRDILGIAKGLKVGSITYAIFNCTLEDFIAEEDIRTFISQEIKAVTAVFSAQYVVPELYELASYWSMHVLGCTYAYDGVRTGGDLVNALGVKMTRLGDEECSVVWGGDKEYREPYTVSSEYSTFSTVTKATSLVPVLGGAADKDVADICDKVMIIAS